MGIDCYMHWHGMTDAEHDAQITGFSSTAGATGYLREAYHGGPYATRYLVQEAFEDDAAREAFQTVYDAAPDDAKPDYKGPTIPAATLRQRLPAAIIMAVYRAATVYGERSEDDWVVKLNDPPPADKPVDPAKKQDADRMDHPEEVQEVMNDPRIRHKLNDIFAGIEIMKGGGDEKVFAAGIPEDLLAFARERIASRQMPDYCLSFVDFVRLAELKEKATGQPVCVYASY